MVFKKLENRVTKEIPLKHKGCTKRTRRKAVTDLMTSLLLWYFTGRRTILYRIYLRVGASVPCLHRGNWDLTNIVAILWEIFCPVLAAHFDKLWLEPDLGRANIYSTLVWVDKLKRVDKKRVSKIHNSMKPVRKIY